MKLLQQKPESLTVADYNPAIRTEKNNLKKLLQSIKDHGILYPLLVDKKMNVIDGHRRLACAKKLKLNQVPILVSDTRLTKDDCYETINTTARKMASTEMIYVYVHGGKVPHQTENRIKKLEKIVGTPELKKLSNQYVSTAVLGLGQLVGRYCGDRSDELVKKTILWSVKHKQGYKARKAIEEGVSKSALKKVILADRPLKHEWR